MPFCQYAIADRGSSTWWLVFWPTNVSIDDERRVLEAGLDVAVRPLVGVLAERQLPGGRRGEVLLGPFQLLNLGPRRRRLRAASAGGRRSRWRRRARPHVPRRARVRAARTKARDRIDGKRQRLEFDDDLFDRFRGGELVDRGDGENRLAFDTSAPSSAPRSLIARLETRSRRASAPACDPGNRRR